MFSPVGKKKVLLQIKRAREQGRDVDDILATLHSPNHKNNQVSIDDDEEESFDEALGRIKIHRQNVLSQVKINGNFISNNNLIRLLRRDDIVGKVMEKLLEATSRYRPDRDSILLKSFESKAIDYRSFRNALQSAFWLTYNEQEYGCLCAIFDKTCTDSIDGYQFMIAFIKLNTIRKDNEADRSRLLKRQYDINQQHEITIKKLETEKKMKVRAIFTIDESDRIEALNKLKKAAKDFDPKHPQSPSLDGLMGIPSVTVAEFKQMLNLTFKLAVNRKELGAVLVEFYNERRSAATTTSSKLSTNNHKNVARSPTGTAGSNSPGVNGDNNKVDSVDSNDNGNNDGGDDDGADDSTACTNAASETVPISQFIKYFLRLGLDLRNDERLAQLKKQSQLDEIAEKERIKKQQEADSKLTTSIDYDYSERDEKLAMHKLVEASTKYDKNAPGCQGLDGFECESLTAVEFKDLVRRTFNLNLSPTEMGYIMTKYGVNGRIVCKGFLGHFMKLGIDERYKLHMKQLERQRLLDAKAKEEHERKVKEISEKKSFRIDFEYTATHMANAMSKLTDASRRYDPSRGVSLVSFEPAMLTQQEFKDALIRTFNVTLTPKELGAIVIQYNREHDLSNTGNMTVHCKNFLNAFFALGQAERHKALSSSLLQCRENEKARKEEQAKKLAAQANKIDIEIDYEYNESERDVALSKLTDAATRYDRNHPAAKSLDGFDCKTVPATLLKELLRRTFDLKLTPKECGAISNYFDKDGTNQINCHDFLNVFIGLGISERAKAHKLMLDKQAKETAQRIKDDKAKVDALVLKPIEVDTTYTEDDRDSAMKKLLIAAEGFDKNHPAAPSLTSFDALYHTPGQFKESLKRTFNLTITAKELGYLCDYFDPKTTGTIVCKDFMRIFNQLGKDRRDEKHRMQLEMQRNSVKKEKEDHEKKIAQQWATQEMRLDWQFDAIHKERALSKMIEAAAKFDKNHPASASLGGFTSGSMKAVEFNGLIQRVFSLWLTPKELSALIHEFKWDDTAKTIDSKAFLNKIIQTGFDERARLKSSILDQQRRAAIERGKEEDRKRKALSSKGNLDLDRDFTTSDLRSAMAKLQAASARYDKNAPGCVSLEAFNAKYLTPSEFKEQLKRTFNVQVNAKELSALIREYDSTGDEVVQSQSFLVSFLKLGAQQRAKEKSVQLEVQRQQNNERNNISKAKLKEAEDKMVLNISYNYTLNQKNLAFDKLRHAAKKFDKNHPSSMSLDGFEVKELDTCTFREMLRRTFNVTLDAVELGAVIQHFDPESKGTVPSRDFLRHFLHMGIAERNKEHTQTLKQLRIDAEEREREKHEKLASQWAKKELGLKHEYNDKDKQSAVAKLTEAAWKFDPRNTAPGGVLAFQSKSMSSAIFREMLKRAFNMTDLTDRELAALMSLFQKNDKKEILCSDFMLKFTQLGYEQRNDRRLKQLSKQRKMNDDYKKEQEEKRKAVEERGDVIPEYDFKQSDFNSAFTKIKGICAHFEMGSSTAPSLAGFMGSNMTAGQFKDMIARTFKVSLSAEELGCLVSYFDTDNTQQVDTQEFLAYFYKTVRDEHDRVRKLNIQAELDVQKKKKLEVINKVKLLEKEEGDLLVYTHTNEVTFLDKIRKSAQEYAVDSSSFVEPLQGFKGPALSPKAFRELFYRIFMIRFTFPEIGVLLSLFGDAPGGGKSIDGPRFLNWFYKLSRLEEKIMLNEADDDVTLDTLRVAPVTVTALPRDPLLNNGDGIQLRRAATAPSNKSRDKSRQSATSFTDTSATAATVSMKSSDMMIHQSRPSTQGLQRRHLNSDESEEMLANIELNNPRNVENSGLFMPAGDEDSLEYRWIRDMTVNHSFSPKLDNSLQMYNSDDDGGSNPQIQRENTAISAIITKKVGASITARAASSSGNRSRSKGGNSDNSFVFATNIPNDRSMRGKSSNSDKNVIINAELYNASALFTLNTQVNTDLIPGLDFQRPKTGIAAQLSAVTTSMKRRQGNQPNDASAKKKVQVEKMIKKQIKSINSMSLNSLHEAHDKRSDHDINQTVSATKETAEHQHQASMGVQADSFYFPVLITPGATV